MDASPVAVAETAVGELTVAPSAGELITTSVAEVGVGAGAAGGLPVDVSPVELPPLVVLPPELVLPLELPPVVELPELELVPGAEEVPLTPAPALGLVVPAEPADETFVFAELSTDFV
ncbi:MAG TPA: hypothetical protein VFU50_06830 [Terriglobales bacterium]|nr:hypothetical protein [Terriglobales bacterium]